jgi:hypothetical protein
MTHANKELYITEVRAAARELEEPKLKARSLVPQAEAGSALRPTYYILAILHTELHNWTMLGHLESS